MKHDPETHRRRSIRLADYDYGQPGAYFFTLCTQGRACLFGEVVDGQVRLNGAGAMVQTVWDELPTHYRGVETDAFVIMPNHVHGVVVLVVAGHRACPDPGHRQPQGQPQGVAPTMSLPDVVHRFKTMTTRRYAEGVKQSGWPPFSGRFWQRNYYEHVIRDERSLDGIREYIIANPMQWECDPENPVGAGPRACPVPGEPWRI